MTLARLSQQNRNQLIIAVVLEAFCFLGGLAMYFITDKMIWIIIGVVAGTGFTLPLILKLFSASKENDDA